MNAKAECSVNKDSSSNSEWAAYLRLNLSPTARGVRLTEKEHHGPLYVQKPFYPESPTRPHIYLLHPPGGLVSGDRLNIEVNVAPDASVLVTTPGAGRIYRARQDRARQSQVVTLNVADQACIEWLPLEAILFPDANASNSTEIFLEGTGKTVYWDVTSLGLPANNQPFSQGCFDQCLKIYRDRQLVLQERLVLDDRSRQLLAANIGFRNLMVQGFMVAGPFCASNHSQNALHQIIEQLRACDAVEGLLTGITVVSDFIVIRGLGNCSESLRNYFGKLWAHIRPELLGCPACPPRIWST